MFQKKQTTVDLPEFATHVCAMVRAEHEALNKGNAIQTTIDEKNNIEVKFSTTAIPNPADIPFENTNSYMTAKFSINSVTGLMESKSNPEILRTLSTVHRAAFEELVSCALIGRQSAIEAFNKVSDKKFQP